MFRKLNPDAIARLNEPNQGLSYRAAHHGQRKYDPDTGKAYIARSEPATLTIYGERAETVMAIIENCETVAAALPTPAPPVDETDRLREAAQTVVDEAARMTMTMRRRKVFDALAAALADRTQEGEARRG